TLQVRARFSEGRRTPFALLSKAPSSAGAGAAALERAQLRLGGCRGTFALGRGTAEHPGRLGGPGPSLPKELGRAFECTRLRRVHPRAAAPLAPRATEPPR